MIHNSDLQQILKQTLGESPSVCSAEPIAGGCINDARKIVLADGRTFFVKQNRAERFEMFETEMIGLKSLAQTGVARVPQPFQAGIVGQSAYLVLEWIEPGRAEADSSQRLGTMLAQLHSAPGPSSYGFPVDNFLGSTPQHNEPHADWPEFFVTRRLEPQLAWARQKGFRWQTPTDQKFWNRIRNLITVDSAPRLIHGDLWNGNYLIGPRGQPFLIDPAPYWAHHEAEFGILTLFGGFDNQFFNAYREIIPPEDGFEDRLKIYQLYHYLNHLNLFGASYLGSCDRLLRELS